MGYSKGKLKKVVDKIKKIAKKVAKPVGVYESAKEAAKALARVEKTQSVNYKRLMKMRVLSDQELVVVDGGESLAYKAGKYLSKSVKAVDRAANRVVKRYVEKVTGRKVTGDYDQHGSQQS